MTMFPAHLSSSNYVNGGFSDGGYDCFISIGRGFSDLMADDESRTGTSIGNEEARSSSKKVNVLGVNINTDDDDHGRWLQLSLGGGHMNSTTSHTPAREIVTDVVTTSLSVDLDLLTGGGSERFSYQREQHQPPPQVLFQRPEFQTHETQDLRATSTTFFLQPQQSAAAMNSVPFMTLQHPQQQVHQQQNEYQIHQQQQQQQETTNYNFVHFIRPSFPTNMMTPAPPASSSSSFSGSSEQYGRAAHVHRRLNVARVINPPRRPHSGVWFMLQASQNQAKEPFLPQIPKSYLRIRDGRMTVGLLIKYLVNKLELGSESEVEITCKGQQLLSLSTLQHVRDTIWNSPRNDVGFSVVPQSSATINHLMVLNYGRIA